MVELLDLVRETEDEEDEEEKTIVELMEVELVTAVLLAAVEVLSTAVVVWFAAVAELSTVVAF